MRIRVLRATGLAGLLGLICLTAIGEEPKANRALEPGKMIPSACRSFLVTDGRFPPTKTPEGKEQPDPRNRAGKIHCLVCENGLAPVIAVFVRADPDSLSPDKGVGELIKKINDLIPKYRADKLASFVTFLRVEGGTKVVTIKTVQEDKSEIETKVEQDLEYPDESLEKREKTVDSIRKFAASLNTPNIPFGLAAEKSKAISQWEIKDDAEVTVVVYYKMREVKEPWSFKSANDIPTEEIAKILKSAEDAIKGTKR